MQISFMTWVIKPEDRKEVSVDPTRVETTAHFSPPFTASWGEEFPAATKIVMRNKQEFIVQGSFKEVKDKLNEDHRCKRCDQLWELHSCP